MNARMSEGRFERLKRESIKRRIDAREHARMIEWYGINSRTIQITPKKAA